MKTRSCGAPHQAAAKQRLGRNDPCPSGAGVKFKKCLLKHPKLRTVDTAADIWWFCDQWTAPMPDYQDLCNALIRIGWNGPPAKLQALLEALFQRAAAAVRWDFVLSTYSISNFNDWVTLFRRIKDHVPDEPPNRLAFCYSEMVDELIRKNPDVIPELIDATLRISDQTAFPEALLSMHEDLLEAGLDAECARLEERFPTSLAEARQERLHPKPEPATSALTEFENPNDEWDDDDSDSDLPEEVQAELDKVWEQFEQIEQPAREDMDRLVDGLLALPFEGTQWSDVIHRLAEDKHPDLPGVYRRIVATVPPTSENETADFYWAAAEEFKALGCQDMMAEVVADFCRLDEDSFFVEALDHIEYILIDEGRDDLALQLAEHFLPALRKEKDLFPGVLVEYVQLIFDLRVGRYLRQDARPSLPEVIHGLLKDLDPETEILPRFAEAAAEIITQSRTEPEWTHDSFALVSSKGLSMAEQTDRRVFLHTAHIWIAREAWRIEEASPSRTLVGMNLVEQAAYRWRDELPRHPHDSNLLASLNAKGIEARCVRECTDSMGPHKTKAELMLAALGTLLRFAQRHALIPEDNAKQSEKQLARLQAILDCE